MITIKTQSNYLEELKSFLQDMGCKLEEISKNEGTYYVITHPGRDGKEKTSILMIAEVYPAERGGVFWKISIFSTVGFEQKLLVKARKKGITILGRTVKPLQVEYRSAL